MQKIGIPGGGQLGRMLLQAAANYPVEAHPQPLPEGKGQCFGFIRDVSSYSIFRK